MRSMLILLGTLIGLVGLGSAAEAQNYPWCAYYGGSDNGGGENCGFSTRDQCMATVSGIGGYCALNTQYKAPGAPARPHHPVRHKHRRHPG